MTAGFVGALDQGTSSTRFLVFDHEGTQVASHQLEHRQFLAGDGWVEHDPIEIWRRALETIEAALGSARLVASDLAAVGITNQRETTVVWDRATGDPVAPAIVWQDARTSGRVAELAAAGRAAMVRARTGLPLSTYSSATKLEWILEHVPGARGRAEAGELAFGTVESFLVWRLTGEHVTDVTNASRTMLMDLETLDWDDELLECFGIPRALLAPIGPSTRDLRELVVGGTGTGLDGVAIGALLGDQQAALVGQRGFSPGDAKCTYGSGSFLLVHTGDRPLGSAHGLITTVAYQFAGAPPAYALEGSIATTGSAIQWLCDGLSVIERAEECESLAASVADSDGLYFVPALSGMLAPYWDPDARGVIVGLSRAHTRAHLARATLEAVAFETRDVIGAMADDLGAPIAELRADGGMTASDLLMQIQADVLGIAVARSPVREATAFGAALAAGIAAGFWSGLGDLPRPGSGASERFEPTWSEEERARRAAAWHRAIGASRDWRTDAPR